VVAELVHLELHTDDLPAARAFYRDLCGWRAGRVETRHGSYLEPELGAGPSGGIVECGTERALCLPYVEVSGVAEATARAQRLGASVMLEPREEPKR
jgi:predicted enzyme related to lactoylglutathione lyase